MSFKFDLRSRVAITESGEFGEVIGRAEYSHAENSYLIRYKAANGQAFEAWWTESALELHAE
ncbi:hypothetical protein [Burkholderia multivorans]|uniref:hypothetical protein n=1 Tax=Burkholderia multivorans TaxID=87883 RepID=UPI00285E8C37|nr:hypothetical protein [Burkholderia multivorans]MDR8920538.1 hypothetical protein [Burkholderia multivorans]MDR8921943.1 hypothetical protein [Burkholderia multivorans]MDR8967822.1 hypothetical protein [Burkholderia multivorans]MDR8993495.1 hypothetical protein [Burkholderia multivorans]MDR9019600.1 hypothetical protein [Burkholderia multivorans]